MKNSEWSKLDVALKGLDGLPEGALAADRVIVNHLKQKFAELLVDEHRRRRGGGEDEGAIMLWASQMANREVLDPPSLYNLFDMQLRRELREFWGRLDIAGPGSSPKGGREVPAPTFRDDAQWNMREGRRFHCSEGCEFVGDELYLAHRDRGHHPVPV